MKIISREIRHLLKDGNIDYVESYHCDDTAHFVDLYRYTNHTLYEIEYSTGCTAEFIYDFSKDIPLLINEIYSYNTFEKYNVVISYNYNKNGKLKFKKNIDYHNGDIIFEWYNYNKKGILTSKDRYFFCNHHDYPSYLKHLISNVKTKKDIDNICCNVYKSLQLNFDKSSERWALQSSIYNGWDKIIYKYDDNGNLKEEHTYYKIAEYFYDDQNRLINKKDYKSGTQLIYEYKDDHIIINKAFLKE